MLFEKEHFVVICLAEYIFGFFQPIMSFAFYSFLFIFQLFGYSKQYFPAASTECRERKGKKESCCREHSYISQ